MQVNMSLSFVPAKQEYTGTDGVYVALEPISGGRKIFNIVSDVLRKSKIKPEPAESYHVTVVWSDKAPDHSMVNMMLEDSKTYRAKIAGVTSWAGHDNDGYVVIELESSDLLQRHKEWLKAGASHSFPDYRAHITIAKNLDLVSAQGAVKELDAYFKAHPTTIVFGNETATDRKS